MTTTVILCTYNRSRSLADSLESIASQQIPESTEWEVLVVDNNSNDETRSVVESFCSRYPGRFRYFFEKQQGKSHALNAGIREAKGDILAFMDDDATVEATWLNNLTMRFSDVQWGGIGGRILPVWPYPPPHWLPLNGQWDLGPFAVFDQGPEAGPLYKAPFGANMAFRKAMFEKHGGFRTDLGPNPDNMIRDEDTEFGNRLLAAGERLYYEPSAVVFHPVSKDRMRKTYLLNWWFGKGSASMRQFGVRPGTKYYSRKVPLYLVRRLGVWTLRWMATLKPRSRFRNKCTVWFIMGSMMECRRKIVLAPAFKPNPADIDQTEYYLNGGKP